jgi:hypothetical protein
MFYPLSTQSFTKHFTKHSSGPERPGPAAGPPWGRLHFGQRHFVVAEEHLRGPRQALRPLQEELQHGLQHSVVILQLEQEAWSRWSNGWEGINKK